MDYHGRRGRRGRGHSYISQAMMPRVFTPPQYAKPWCFLSSIYSFIIMSSLIALIYLMLDYHCTTCNAKCDLNNITKNLEDIARNISVLKDNYYDLEMKISKFSQELPKIEGQIDILEAFTNTIEGQGFGWDPKNHLTLPNVDVFLNKPILDQKKNVSKKCSRHLHKRHKVNKD